MSNEHDNQSLQDALSQLSQKSDVLSDEVKQAKKSRDDFYGFAPADQHRFKRQETVIEAFNRSVEMLIAVFRRSRFDEFALFISSPIKMITVSLVSGFFRGIGFVGGILFLGYLAYHLLPQDFLTVLLKFFQS